MFAVEHVRGIGERHSLPGFKDRLRAQGSGEKPRFRLAYAEKEKVQRQRPDVAQRCSLAVEVEGVE